MRLFPGAGRSRSPPRRRRWRLASASSASLCHMAHRQRAHPAVLLRRVRRRGRSRLPGAVGPRGERHAASLRRGPAGVAHRRRSAVGDRSARASRLCSRSPWNVTPLGGRLAQHRVRCHRALRRLARHRSATSTRISGRLPRRGGRHGRALARLLPGASPAFPLVRGWFRQDDFPSDALLYRPPHTRRCYQRWLRKLGVAYVVLTRSPPDYSSRGEAALVRSGRAELRPRLGVAGGSDLRGAAAAAHRHRARPADRVGAGRVAPRRPRHTRQHRTASQSTGRPTGTHPPAAWPRATGGMLQPVDARGDHGADLVRRRPGGLLEAPPAPRPPVRRRHVLPSNRLLLSVSPPF